MDAKTFKVKSVTDVAADRDVKQNSENTSDLEFCRYGINCEGAKMYT